MPLFFNFVVKSRHNGQTCNAQQDMLFRDHSEVRTGNNTHFIEPTQWDLLKNNNRGGSFNLLMILEF